MPYGCELFACLSVFSGAWRYPRCRLATSNSTFFMVHIGQLIKSELIRQERTPTWLAKKVNCDRSNMYYIFSQQSINTDLLLRISRALNHDFFKYYTTELVSNTTEEVWNLSTIPWNLSTHNILSLKHYIHNFTADFLLR